MTENDAVEAYLDFLGDMYAGMYNASGRAYPDVSAQGLRVEIVVDDGTGLADGTCESSQKRRQMLLITDPCVSV